MTIPLPYIASRDDSPRARLTRLVRPLLEQLLVRATRFQETPLQFEIDSAGVVLAVWGSFSADLPTADRRLLADGAQVYAALDWHLEQALNDADPTSDGMDDVRGDLLSSEATRLGIGAAGDVAFDSPLVRTAEWFDELCGTLRAVHVRATEVVRLRIEGYGFRDIAVRLGTGAHLVRRILADVRCELEQVRRRDPTRC